MYTLYSTRNVFPKLRNSGHSSKESSAVTYYHAFHFPRNHLIALHPVSRFTAASIKDASMPALWLYTFVQCIVM